MMAKLKVSVISANYLTIIKFCKQLRLYYKVDAAALCITSDNAGCI
jgi:hypothetical protein